MNWKKEGYQKDQKVFLVSKGMFTRDVKFHEGIVTHAGTKILKIKLDSMKKDLEFKNSTYASRMTGYGYYLYKSKEEYNKEIKEINYKSKLIQEVKNRLYCLTNEQLEQIIQWIKE